MTITGSPLSVTSASVEHFDYVVIGGGIVGVSTAWQLQRKMPSRRVLLLEKEPRLAMHQTGHNSGVIHAGVYYPPESLKAKFCRQGLKDTLAFCRAHGIAYEQCGKLIVATCALEVERLAALFKRSQQNGLDVRWLNKAQLREREPNVEGLAAVFVKDTGIADYPAMTEAMAREFEQAGGKVRCGARVGSLVETADEVMISVTLESGESTQIGADYLIVCGGLMADRLTQMMGLKTDFQIVPFRGEYYQLPAKYNQLVNHLIYPVPDPALPFLGVHLTRMIDGSVSVGPNAVQGFKREGYKRFNFSFRDCWAMFGFSGFWKLLWRHRRTGLQEFKNSLWKPGYLKLVQKYCPVVELKDLQPYPAGIRAQAVLKDGTLVHDFLFRRSARSLHVCNAPSPAATSAIPIGAYIVEKISDQEIESSS